MNKTKFSEYLSSKGHCDEDGIIDIGAKKVDVPAEKIKAPEDPQKQPKPKVKAKNIEEKKGKLPQVKEYLDDKGKLVEKPKTELVPDVHFTPPTVPPQAKTKGKGWDAKAPKEVGAKGSYGPANSNAKPKNGEAGLAEKGSIPKQEIKIKQGSSTAVPGGKTIEGWEKKTKSEVNNPKEYVQLLLQRFHEDVGPAIGFDGDDEGDDSADEETEEQEDADEELDKEEEELEEEAGDEDEEDEEAPEEEPQGTQDPNASMNVPEAYRHFSKFVSRKE